MKTWIGLAVTVGLAIGWAISRFNGDATHRREHFQELASSSGALAEWKGIWNAANPMPPLVREPVGEKPPLLNLPGVPPLLQVNAVSKTQDSTEAHLERVLEKLEQIERLLVKLDKKEKDHAPDPVDSLDNSSRSLLEMIVASVGDPSLTLFQLCAEKSRVVQKEIRFMQLMEKDDIKGLQDYWQQVWFEDHPPPLRPTPIPEGLQKP
jgi:hypothetical protein